MSETPHPPPLPAGRSSASEAGGDATGGVIPYKNPQALTAYYLGIFALIPVIGFFLGIASVVLGILGLRYRKTNPRVRGSVHAWIGIILGAVVVVGHLALVGLMVFAG